MQDVCEAICDARAWERALGDLEEYFGGWEPLASPLDDSSFDEHVAELVGIWNDACRDDEKIRACS